MLDRMFSWSCFDCKDRWQVPGARREKSNCCVSSDVFVRVGIIVEVLEPHQGLQRSPLQIKPCTARISQPAEAGT